MTSDSPKPSEKPRIPPWLDSGASDGKHPSSLTMLRGRPRATFTRSVSPSQRQVPFASLTPCTSFVDHVRFQILSGKPPYHDILSHGAMVLAIFVLDKRPPRTPSHAPTGDSYEPLWALAERCWAKDPEARPLMREVFDTLAPATAYTPTNFEIIPLSNGTDMEEAIMLHIAHPSIHLGRHAVCRALACPSTMAGLGNPYK